MPGTVGALAGSLKQLNRRRITTGDNGKWHAHTSERIKNLRPLAVMHADVYRKDRPRLPMSGAIFYEVHS